MMADMFLGEDLILWLLLALGGALFAGNLLAILKPMDAPQDDDHLERAPLTRSLVYAGLGLITAGWALASLIAG